MVTVCGAEDVPTAMLPKLKLIGLMLRVSVAAIPVPLSPTEVGEVGALLMIKMLPDTVPTEVGRKATVIVVCCPAFTFKGTENPLTVKKAEPVSVTWLMLSVAVPVLVMVKTWDKVLGLFGKKKKEKNSAGSNAPSSISTITFAPG